MEKEETKKYIDDQIVRATNSAIMALTNVIGDFGHRLEKHKEDEKEDENRFKEKLIATIREEIKITVNGKIDNIKKTQDKDREVHETFMKEVREYMQGINPIKKDFDEKASFWNQLTKKGKTLVFASLVIAAILTIKDYLIALIHNIK